MIKKRRSRDNFYIFYLGRVVGFFNAFCRSPFFRHDKDKIIFIFKIIKNAIIMLINIGIGSDKNSHILLEWQILRLQIKTDLKTEEVWPYIPQNPPSIRSAYLFYFKPGILCGFFEIINRPIS